MISVITSVHNKEKWEKFLVPSLQKTQEFLNYHSLPQLDVIAVAGTKSIFKNYQKGTELAKYPIKAYIHEDVDLINPQWLIRIYDAFASYPNTGLVGFVGTTKLQDKGFWWESGQEYIFGELFSGFEKANWSYKVPTIPTLVECIDGFFMATNRSLTWDTNLFGFHCYDMDMCRTVKKTGLDIMVVPHKAHHIGEIRTNEGVQELFDIYYKKWNLMSQK